jgi:hypothetical protein
MVLLEPRRGIYIYIPPYCTYIRRIEQKPFANSPHDLPPNSLFCSPINSAFGPSQSVGREKMEKNRGFLLVSRVLLVSKASAVVMGATGGLGKCS